MAITVFVTGGTGYMGRRLIPMLLARGHSVRALARAESRDKLPAGCEVVIGNALNRSTFADSIAPATTFVQLVGVPHPSPSKAKEFREIDLASARESVAAAVAARTQHFVYVSVAHPAPVMRAYIEARSAGEELVRESGMNATILRPWYVLGPGHRWPYALLPIYWLLERLPATSEGARRLGLVSLSQMLAAVVRAVEDKADGIRIVTVPEIRSARYHRPTRP